MFSLVSSLRSQRSRGFTLVELLVVIAILSILAVAGLAALNPAEILRKGRDSDRHATASELVKAIERFNTTQPCNPWEGPPGCGTALNPSGVNVTAALIQTGGMAPLVTSQDLKANFVNKRSISNADLYYTENTTTGGTSVCFEPESNGARVDGSLGSLYATNAGTGTGTCTGSYPSTNCYVCVQ